MYRQIDTATWDDPWFAELEPDAKLLFLYMLTNRRSTAAGVFEITERAMAFETGLTVKRVTDVLESISSRVRWWPEYQTVWVRNFLRHQAPSPNLFKSAWNEMLDQPDDVREEVGTFYPLLTDANTPPDKKEEIQTLMEGYTKGSQRVRDGSRKTSLVKTSTRLEEDSSLENGADAPNPTTTPETNLKPKPKPKRATQVPADFAVSEKVLAWGKEQGYTPEQMHGQVPRFIDHYTAKGEPRKDWDASFRQWMRNAESYGHLRSPGSLTVHKGGKPSGVDISRDSAAQIRREMGWDDDDITDVIDTTYRSAP